ncbi:MAG: thiamine pyrophosphate-dependent dehydrogenase E1 component subunit alpha [Alphaproteobacteria bacterium]
MTLPNDDLLEMYRRMARIRHFENTCHELYQRGQIAGVLHLSTGQEAVSVGACFDLSPDDYITSTHRGHNDIIAKGADLTRMMDELFMKETGYCRAKGGSMHIADFKLGILGANGIVGAGIPIATGAALAIKMRDEKRVVVCFFGDGAVNQGFFHEGINLASIWRLPVVFVCHNNAWADSTPQAPTHAVADIAERAKAYGIPGVTVDAIDVTAVREVCATAIARARAGEGPSLINCKTYRWYGHHMGDVDQSYRPKQDLAVARGRDCLAFHRERLLRAAVADVRFIESIDREVAAEIAAAVEHAKAAPRPGADTLYEDIFAGIDAREEMAP